MPKRAKAPKGFYSASEVMRILGIGNSTLYHNVEIGKIKKVVPPDRQEGYYIKSEIDKMARAKELFMLQYATDATLFEKADIADIQGITDLCIELFSKNGTASYETRLSQYKTNNDIFYVLRQDDIIVGYIGIFPLKHEAIEVIMSGVNETSFRTSILSPENITQFTPGQTEEVFLVIGAKQDLKRSTIYGARLISGAVEVFENLARQGVILKHLYGTSRTRDGIRIAKGLGFKQVTPDTEEDNLLRFELDLEKTKLPLFKKYQAIVKRVSDKANKPTEP